jgi:isoleucyl-tRNA synthetase
MPYGQFLYPFENKELFECTYPADFIPRLVLYTSRPFNISLRGGTLGEFDCNGSCAYCVCAFIFIQPSTDSILSDGKKMSKRNYPDPNLIIDKYGADATR